MENSRRTQNKSGHSHLPMSRPEPFPPLTDVFWAEHPGLAIAAHPDLVSDGLPDRWSYCFDESAGLPVWFNKDTQEEITDVEKARKEFHWSVAHYRTVKRQIEL